MLTKDPTVSGCPVVSKNVFQLIAPFHWLMVLPANRLTDLSLTSNGANFFYVFILIKLFIQVGDPKINDKSNFLMFKSYILVVAKSTLVFKSSTS